MTREHDGTAYSLAPCPFCGLDRARFANCQEVEACERFRRCEESHYYTVVCSCGDKGCGASTGFWPTREEAAAQWNRRTGSLRLETLLQMIEENTCGGNAPSGLSGGPEAPGRYEPSRSAQARQSDLHRP